MIDELRNLQFQLNGGWPVVFAGLIGFVIKWFAIGALVHLGWKAVRP